MTYVACKAFDLVHRFALLLCQELRWMTIQMAGRQRHSPSGRYHTIYTSDFQSEFEQILVDNLSLSCLELCHIPG